MLLLGAKYQSAPSREVTCAISLSKYHAPISEFLKQVIFIFIKRYKICQSVTTYHIKFLLLVGAAPSGDCLSNFEMAFDDEITQVPSRDGADRYFMPDTTIMNNVAVHKKLQNWLLNYLLHTHSISPFHFHF